MSGHDFPALAFHRVEVGLLRRVELKRSTSAYSTARSKLIWPSIRYSSREAFFTAFRFRPEEPAGNLAVELAAERLHSG